MFFDRSDRIVHNPPFLAYGVAVTDADGDGRFEFVVAGYGFPNRALAWDGNALIDRFDRTLSAYDRQAIGVAAGDIDGDGQE
ncbi:MAG: VCBS repeat-containing protein, partial [Capsulimonadales bacterium]|nr:VCBS repeat-containing protein [Capsulimonadales bacterium]